jgi:hypothetical protein
MYVKLAKKKLFRKTKMTIVLDESDIKEAVKDYLVKKQWPLKDPSVELFCDEEVTAEVTENE